MPNGYRQIKAANYQFMPYGVRTSQAIRLRSAEMDGNRRVALHYEANGGAQSGRFVLAVNDSYKSSYFFEPSDY